MKALPIFNPSGSAKNIIVEVAYQEDSEKRRCVGVLVQETMAGRRIGFNAIDDDVTDYLDLAAEQILEIRRVCNTIQERG